MRSRSTSSALVVTCVLALAACGEATLDALPADATAVVSVDASDDFAFVSWRLDNDSCVQLPEDTTVTFNGTPPNAGDLTFGGRGGNPLAAYLDFGCEVPSAYWNFTSPPSTPYVFKVGSGEVTLVVELSDPREFERCDFPACASESSPVERESEAP